MLNKLLSIAKKFDIEVVFLNEVCSSGGFLPEADLIFVNANKSEHEIVRILAHEIGHAIKHKKQTALYVASNSAHSKMEYEAECDTIDFLITNYLSDDSLELDQLNSIRIMNQYNIDYSYENIVKQSIYYFFANKKANQYRKY
ncbi:ImmA/IrrE family metallo-endopeptidase [Enterococcus sp. BWR-S5]|uniref:ImmA/IrrE family metallo-endopeptidase n=1 Tax=Enterococcus sp. BWR-S5 TaxID=2787714 RepID=UPI001921AA2D|nr:ImmA/IrrE family metallo-endopeptidase [Enterococcus sp. BWR-S5]MBL1223708.1 ImmA/IrrE family metallo-endopeptidase [Enterococcus sp. BWR-S5]